MTLTEFMHPLTKAGRREQVQAVLYFGKHYGGQDQMSVAEIREALGRARMPGARTVNIPQILARSVPNVHQVGERGVWAITRTGEERLRDESGLPTAEPEAASDVTALQRLASRVADEASRDYIEEAVGCLQVGARRAAVVFLWTGAVSSIREVVWRRGAAQIEAALRVHNPKARFKKRGDFANVKDGDLLQIAQDMEIYDKSQKKRLGEGLDLRNDCGHPVKYRPGEKKVASFIEDLVGIVWP